MQPNSPDVDLEEPHSQQESSSAEEISIKVRELGAEALEFDWQNKWLKGQEYSHMLRHMDRYCSTYHFAKYSKKTHPESIYSEPQNGTIYFVEGDSIGSEFGFPRVSIKKRYRWKKMNFTTDLPKKRPEVTYIVASAVKCERFFPNSKNEGPLFRMHAVMLYKNEQPTKQTFSSEQPEPEQPKRYVLCHIRKLDITYKTADKKKRQLGEEAPPEVSESAREDKSEAKESTSLLELAPPGVGLAQSFVGGIDYFLLFKHLHNLHCKDLE